MRYMIHKLRTGTQAEDQRERARKLRLQLDEAQQKLRDQNQAFDWEDTTGVRAIDEDQDTTPIRVPLR
jgi:hypothetical protein